MLFINYQQTQILKENIFLIVNGVCLLLNQLHLFQEFFCNLNLLCFCLKPRERFNPHRKLCGSISECIVMLFCQNGCRYKRATCFPSLIALNDARTAISVLPKPTSPQTRRSIGFSLSISRLTSSGNFCLIRVSS